MRLILAALLALEPGALAQIRAVPRSGRVGIPVASHVSRGNPLLVPLRLSSRKLHVFSPASIRPGPTVTSLPSLDAPAVVLKSNIAEIGTGAGDASHGVPVESLDSRLERLSQGSTSDLKELDTARGESSRMVVQKGFDRLVDEASIPGVAQVTPEIRASRSSKDLAPSNVDSGAEIIPAEIPAPAAGKTKTVRWYLAGTSVFKIGMEALGLAVPLIAMTVFGSVTWAAVMAVGWVLSQALFGTLSGGLLDRHSSSKILSWSMAGQAAAVAALLGLFAVDKIFPLALGFPLFNPYFLLALYSLAGGFMGASDTARQVIAAEVVGDNEKDVKVFNARTHMAYEISGVIGAVSVGVAIKAFGLIAALVIHPPAYFLAALAFSRMNLPKKKHVVEQKAASVNKITKGIRGYFSDIRHGFKTVWSHPTYKWGMLALVVPLAIHRLLEGLLIPAFAKGVLNDPSSAAWIVGASNFGELIGAILLARILLRPGSGARSGFWVRLMAVGLLGLWAMSFTQELLILLPLIAFGSLSWAASDISLRGKLQNSLPQAMRGRAFGFIGAVGYVTILLASLSLGWLMDAWGGGPIFLAVNAVITVSALLLFKAGKVLTETPKPGQSSKGGKNG